MKSRHKKLALIGGALAIVGIIAALVLNALNSNIALYITPTEVAEGKAPQGKLFRIGGLVKEGSMQRQADGVTISFIITDTAKDIPVAYKGILPDLFKEGKGAVAQGKLDGSGTFVATEVLAKHDSTYMPPQVAQAIARAKAAHRIPADASVPPPAGEGKSPDLAAHP